MANLQFLLLCTNFVFSQEPTQEVIFLYGKDVISIKAINRLIDDLKLSNDAPDLQFWWNSEGANTVLRVSGKWAHEVRMRILSNRDLESKSDSPRSWGTVLSQNHSGIIIEGPGVFDAAYHGIAINELLSGINFGQYSKSNLVRLAVEKREPFQFSQNRQVYYYDLFLEFSNRGDKDTLRLQYFGRKIISQSWIKIFPSSNGYRLGNVNRPY
jgi:hypothetical protein